MEELITLLRPREAASYMRVAASTLARHRVNGTGPEFSKVGRVVVYRRADIDAWLSKRRTTSTSTGSAG